MTATPVDPNQPDRPMCPRDLSGHGLEIVIGADGVELIDRWAPGQPALRLTFAEYEAFLAGVLAGQFDFETLRARTRPVEDGA